MTSKVFQTRAHRERAQPASRARLGLLEKKKDYVLRARDFNSKKKRLQELRVKAAYKNPNEFYFAMQKSHVDRKTGAVNRETGNERLPAEAIKLMKSQDLEYVRETIRVNEHKLTQLKLEHNVVEETEQVASHEDKRRHVKFVEDDDDLAELIVSAGSADNIIQPPVTLKVSEPVVNEYTARKERNRVLCIAERKLVQQKLAMAKGRKRKTGEDEHGIPIYKWDMMRQK